MRGKRSRMDYVKKGQREWDPIEISASTAAERADLRVEHARLVEAPNAAPPENVQIGERH